MFPGKESGCAENHRGLAAREDGAGAGAGHGAGERGVCGWEGHLQPGCFAGRDQGGQVRSFGWASATLSSALIAVVSQACFQVSRGAPSHAKREDNRGAHRRVSYRSITDLKCADRVFKRGCRRRKGVERYAHCHLDALPRRQSCCTMLRHLYKACPVRHSSLNVARSRELSLLNKRLQEHGSQYLSHTETINVSWGFFLSAPNFLSPVLEVSISFVHSSSLTPCFSISEFLVTKHHLIHAHTRVILVSPVIFGLSRVPGDKKFSVGFMFFEESLHWLCGWGFVRSPLACIVVCKVGLTERWHIVPGS